MSFDTLVKIYLDVKRCSEKLSFLETVNTLDEEEISIIKKIKDKAEEILTLCEGVLHGTDE